MPIKGIRRDEELVTAGKSNEADRLNLLESHRDHVIAQIAELQERLQMTNHKIDVFRADSNLASRAPVGVSLTTHPLARVKNALASNTRFLQAVLHSAFTLRREDRPSRSRWRTRREDSSP